MFKAKNLAWSIASILLLLACWAVMGDDSEPDYTDVDDMLENNRRQISWVDDLIAVNPRPDGSGTLLAENLMLFTDQSKIESQTAEGSKYWFQPEECSLDPFPQQTRTARLFAIDRDSLVTLYPSDSASTCDTSKTYSHVYDNVTHGNEYSFRVIDLPSSSRWLQMAVADYDFDGLDEILVIDYDHAYVLSDPDAGQQTWNVGPRTSTGASRTPVSDPVVGDYNNDGVLDVSWVGGDVVGNDGSLYVYTATVCPGSVSNTVCAGKAEWDVVLSDHTISIDAHFGNNCHPTSTAMAGDFASLGYEQLMVSYVRHDSDCKVDVYYYEANSELEWSTVAYKSDLISGGGNQDLITVYGQAGPLSWFDDTDQGLLGVGVKKNGDNEVHLYIFTYKDNTLAWQGKELQSSDHLLYGLALGRYNDDDSDAEAYNPQIAVLTQKPSDNDAQVLIYDIDCSDNDASCSQDPYDPEYTVGDNTDNYTLEDWQPIGSADHDRQAFLGSYLRDGDLQGRSIRVGNPAITRVANHSQPDVVLGMPPMHVDYVLIDGQSDPSQTTVVNISGLPSSFVAAYAFEETQSSQSSSLATTSYTSSTSESVGGEVKFGVPVIAGVDATTTETWKQTHENSVSESLETYSSETFDASTTTHSSGQVWYNVSRLNVYYYPVLGEQVCSEEQGSNCSNPEQLYLVLSGPDQLNRTTIESATVEWFQPFTEPFQIFSYPPTLDQLQERIGDIDPLSATNLTFYTDSNGEVFSVAWSEGSSSGSTTGSETTHSFDSNTAVTAGTPNLDDAPAGVNVEGGFDYSSSDSTSNLVSSTVSMGASTGVTINVPGTFLDVGLYSYAVSPLIFGQPLPQGVQQSDSGSSSDIQTTGMLQARYLADPTNAQSGSWWLSDSPYQQAFDVALNHPLRWAYTTKSAPSIDCLETVTGSTYYDCMSFNEPKSDDLWNSEFYWMRGLAIQIGAASGPQRDTAVAGDEVYLTARIYNYSLTEMEDGTEVKVRFYRQPWNTTTNQAVGDSVLIAETTVDDDTIPPFSQSASNWTTVSTSFDTSDLAGTDQLFWVLTWAESAGQLAPELHGHGLSAQPGTLTSIGQVPLEQVTYTSEGETYTTSFSNNVGYYHAAFHISDPSQELSESGSAELSISAVELSKATPAVGEKTIVAVEFAAAGGSVTGIQVIFADTVGSTTRRFDIEKVAFLSGGSTARVEVPWRPVSCGEHELSVTAHTSSGDDLESTLSVVVECDQG